MVMKGKRDKIVEFLLACFVLFFLVGCSDDGFAVNTDMFGKEIIFENHRYYVLNNGIKEEILITKDKMPCNILAWSTNDEGCTVVALSKFCGPTFADPRNIGTTIQITNQKR